MCAVLEKCLLCSVFVLRSCSGFLQDSFHLWCCTATHCNLEYTQAALEGIAPSDLEFGGLGDLEALSCHALQPPDVSPSTDASTSANSWGWESDARMKWTVIVGSIWAGILTAVIVFSCWLCLWLRARDRDKEYVPYGEPMPVGLAQSVLPADLMMSELTDHSNALRTPSVGTPALSVGTPVTSTPVSASRAQFG